MQYPTKLALLGAIAAFIVTMIVANAFAGHTVQRSRSSVQSFSQGYAAPAIVQPVIVAPQVAPVYVVPQAQNFADPAYAQPLAAGCLNGSCQTQNFRSSQNARSSIRGRGRSSSLSIQRQRSR